MTVHPVDIEGEIIALLRGPLGVHVSTRVPNPRPTSHVRVTRAGGSSRNAIQSDPRVLVECWAPDSVAALDLARMAYGLLWAHYGAAGTWGGRASLTEPVNFPDPSTDSARYQFIAQITTNLESA